MRTVFVVTMLFLQASFAGAQNGPTSDRPEALQTLPSDVHAATPSSQAPANDEVILPKGTPACLFSTQRMSSRTAKINDRVTFRVAREVFSNGRPAIGKGTETWATVVGVGRPGHFPHEARLSFAFEPLLVNGQPVPVEERKEPKESLGGAFKDLWDVGGPWLVPLAPLAYLEKEPEKVLTRNTCVWVEIASDTNLGAARTQTQPVIPPPLEAVPALPPAGRTTQPKITEIEVGFGPQGIAFTPDAIWVAWGDDKEFGVSRIDARTNKVLTSIPTGKWPIGVAVGEGAVWVVNRHDHSLTRIDPETNQVVATIPVGGAPCCVAVGDGSIWVTSSGYKNGSVLRIDPHSNTLIATIRADAPSGIAVGSNAVWVASFAGAVLRIDPRTNSVVKKIKTQQPCLRPHVFGLLPIHPNPPMGPCLLGSNPDHPNQLIVQGEQVWITSQDEAVLQIDARSNKIVSRTKIPAARDYFTLATKTDGKPTGVALAGGFLWVADWSNESLWKLDVKSASVVGEPVHVGFNPLILGPGSDPSGAIWVSNSSDGTVMKIEP